MRPLVVVVLDELIKASLLLQEVLARRLGGFLLQRQVHALVSAVLLRLPGLDTLERDPQAQPPHRELAQAEERGGAGEGHAVVGADRAWQAVVLESALEHAESVNLLRALQGI